MIPKVELSPRTAVHGIYRFLLRYGGKVTSCVDSGDNEYTIRIRYSAHNILPFDPGMNNWFEPRTVEFTLKPNE